MFACGWGRRRVAVDSMLGFFFCTRRVGGSRSFGSHLTKYVDALQHGAVQRWRTVLVHSAGEKCRRTVLVYSAGVQS